VIPGPPIGKAIPAQAARGRLVKRELVIGEKHLIRLRPRPKIGAFHLSELESIRCTGSGAKKPAAHSFGELGLHPALALKLSPHHWRRPLSSLQILEQDTHH